MIRGVVLVAVCLAAWPAVLAQFRPSYFPRPGGFSQVLPQYGAGQGGQGGDQGAGQGGDADVNNRDNAPPTPPALPAPGSNNSLEDTQLVNRVQEWPRPNQPFWFLNQQHIAQHTGQRVPCQGADCAQNPQAFGPAPQSSFLGSRGRGGGR